MVKPLKVQEFYKRRGLRWMTWGNSEVQAHILWMSLTHMGFLPMNLMHSDKALGKIYRWRKVVCLFCFIPTKIGILEIMFLVSLENSQGGGVHISLVSSWCLDLHLEVREWFFHCNITLNSSWKRFRRNWNVPLISLERSWRARFNKIYLVRFGFRMIIPPYI